MSKKTILYIIICLIPVLIVIGTILYNSHLDRHTSKDMSRKVTVWLEEHIDVQVIWEQMLDTGVVKNYGEKPKLFINHGKFHAVVRKGAHVVEYTILGIILAFTFYFIKVKWYWKLPVLTAFIVCFPLFDELVQRYSNREFRLFDVKIDICSECFGMLLACSIIGFVYMIIHGPDKKGDNASSKGKSAKRILKRLMIAWLRS